MSEIVINNLHLSLQGPQTLPLSVVLRDSPNYDQQKNLFTVLLMNKSDRTRTLPLDELRRNIVRIYRNLATDTELIDNKIPPPKLDGSTEELAQGETKTIQLTFNYPMQIVTMKNKVAVLSFCVKWDGSWLRESAYALGAIDWNESFELCHEIQILDDMTDESFAE